MSEQFERQAQKVAESAGEAARSLAKCADAFDAFAHIVRRLAENGRAVSMRLRAEQRATVRLLKAGTAGEAGQ